MKQIADSLKLDGVLFEDTIDGYFPLHESLRQMLGRNGFTSAIVTLTFAPIMHIPGLAHDAPVPLNSESGFTGLIESLSVCVSSDAICGFGVWHWWVDEADNPMNAKDLNPMTRLAEPCYITGCGFRTADLSAVLLNPASIEHRNGQRRHDHACSGNTRIVREFPSRSEKDIFGWGPFQVANIRFVDATVALHGNNVSGLTASAKGQYVITYK